MHVLIIGGSKGLGRELVKQFALNGNKVLYMCRNEMEDRFRSPFVYYKHLDLEWIDEAIQHAVKEGVDKHLNGRLDRLVVASGMGAYASPLASDSFIRKMYQVNVFGPFSVWRQSLRYLLRSGGTACFVTSTSARRPGSGGLSVYASTKGAIHSWVISEGRRFASKGVGLFAVAPGFFDSPMTAEMVPELKEKVTKAIPMGRFGDVEEIAHFILQQFGNTNWTLAGQIYECSGGG